MNIGTVYTTEMRKLSLRRFMFAGLRIKYLLPYLYTFRKRQAVLPEFP